MDGGYHQIVLRSGTIPSPSFLHPQAAKCAITLSSKTFFASPLTKRFGEVELAWLKGRSFTLSWIFSTSFGRSGICHQLCAFQGNIRGLVQTKGMRIRVDGAGP